MARIRPALDAFPEATYFEVATALAFQRFADAGVEVAVVETGLGGRLDATNALERPAATVITNVALDHTEVLGPTEEAIAAEKGGIVKPGVPLVTGATGGALGVLRAIAAERGAPLHALGDDFVAAPLAQDAAGQTLEVHGLRDYGEVRIPFAGAHQVENAALALAALDALDAAGVRVPVEAARRGLARARWPGRLQRVEGSPALLLDGAHNPAGAVALAEHLRATGLKPVLLFGALADKDWQTMVEVLAPCVRDAVCTRPPSPRALDPGEAARAFSRAGVIGTVIEEPARALAAAERMAGDDGLVLVTGSLYLVGAVLQIME
jgi:dihydrofolate synthase/folylpolyglutamate synthase